jgi:ABC-2 type transport system ATP-binding protein
VGPRGPWARGITTGTPASGSLRIVTAIRAEGITKHYRSASLPWRPPARAVRALEDVSLEVREGEIFGFLGPNGAGKSTLIRLLLGFLHPTAGRATVLGMDTERDSEAIRARVGYLPGGIALYDSLSGERLLDYLAELSGRPPVRRSELCDRLELSPRTLRRPIRDYSRGMRQKLGIVQALQHDPELAILDEPSEGLDPLMQRSFYEALDGVKAAGRTVFLSSHILSEVERVCDRVAIVRAGRLVALEDVGQLIRRRKRRVEAVLTGPAPDLSAVPGVSEISVADGRLSCALDGDPRPFLAAIAAAPVVDVTIEPARLEEAFLELYAGEEAAEAAAAAELAAGMPRGSAPGDPS